jgi:hypothetical protein
MLRFGARATDALRHNAGYRNILQARRQRVRERMAPQTSAAAAPIFDGEALR